MNFNSTTKSIKPETLYAYKGEIGDDNLIAMMKMSEENHAFSRSRNKNFDSLTEYKKTIKRHYKENYEDMSYKDFIRKTKNSGNRITMSDINNIQTIKENSKMSLKLGKKLCDYFKIEDKSHIFSDNKCYEKPEEYIKIHNAKHIVSMSELTPDLKFDRFALENGVSKALWKDGSTENNGTATLGDAHMAAVGSRASTTWGSRDSHAYSLSGSIFYDGPPNIFFLTYGYSYTQEEYVTDSNDDMHVEFKRWYSDLSKYKVNFSSFALQFNAAIKRCSMIENIRERKLLHLCEAKATENHRDILEERWFLLYDQDIGTNNIATDGARIGDKSFAQVIRGEKNFKKLWSTIDDKNKDHVLDNIGDQKIGHTFQEYLNKKSTTIEEQINKTSNFPGILR